MGQLVIQLVTAFLGILSPLFVSMVLVPQGGREGGTGSVSLAVSTHSHQAICFCLIVAIKSYINFKNSL